MIFFIGFAIEYTVNGLFYNDDTMHKIYESKGEIDIESKLSIIIYSSLISMLLNAPLNFLALSNDEILDFKQSNIKNKIMRKARNLKKILTIKFILFFIISFLLLLFFWYYISMFGVIYKNTQIHLLKDTLMSFGLSLFIPFGIYLLPGLFRIPALSSPKKRRKYLYNFSRFLQSFWVVNHWYNDKQNKLVLYVWYEELYLIVFDDFKYKKKGLLIRVIETYLKNYKLKKNILNILDYKDS